MAAPPGSAPRGDAGGCFLDPDRQVPWGWGRLTLQGVPLPPRHEPCQQHGTQVHTSTRTHMYQPSPGNHADTHRADVFLNSTGAMMEADPWTDRQETFKPLVSS